jgi:hypothetical protein
MLRARTSGAGWSFDGLRERLVRWAAMTETSIDRAVLGGAWYRVGRTVYFVGSKNVDGVMSPMTEEEIRDAVARVRDLDLEPRCVVTYAVE